MIEVNLWTVLLVALVTALATGLGALPFLFVKSVSERTVSLANAAAAGLMLAACHGLIAEGIELSPGRTLIGVLLGLGGIILGQRFVDESQAPTVGRLEGLDARKALLIIGVMTAHSFAEGVGVGVSFGGSGELAGFISTAIAIHNIPEGLAIALVLVPRGATVLAAAAWGVFSSLPQPLMAVPSYLFVEVFEPFLPIGFGLAAGAMIWMVFSELIPEANEKASSSAVGTTVTLAFVAMLAFQYMLLK